MPLRTVKPLTLGLMSKAYTQADRHSLVIVVMGFFPLGKPIERFLNDFESFPTIVKALPAGDPLDALYPKARAEVLLSANAYAAEGKPVTDMPVRLQLGDIDKTLHVFGDRHIDPNTVGKSMSDPAEFVEMPLDWAHAYGGPSHDCNTSGIGYTGKRSTQSLPNIQYPDAAITRGNQNQAPAGFGPRSTLCPDRQALFGTYDQDWQDHYAPNLPKDFKAAAFNTAPADQQINGEFKGGEQYCLQGMHPQHATITGQLPKFRVRIVVQRQGQTCQQATLHETALDTVWMVPHQNMAVCLYRTEIPCSDSDAEDITALLAAYEHQNETPRSTEHYHHALAQRTDIETRHLHVFDDAPLIPSGDPKALQQAKAEHAQKEADELAKRQALLDELDAEFWANSGMDKPKDHPAPKAKPLPLGLVTADAVMSGVVNLADVMKRAEQQMHAVKTQGEHMLKELQQSLKDGELAQLQAHNTAATLDPKTKAKTDKADAEQRAQAQPPSPLADVSEFAKSSGALTPKEEANLDKAQAQLAKIQAETSNMAIKPTQDPLSQEAAAHLRALVKAWLEAGIALAGRDLSGADLHDLDFSGLDLSACNLQLCNLSGAQFKNARLQQTVFIGACIDKARFDAADLSKANLNQITGEHACFQGALLDQASLVDCQLKKVDFSRIRATGLTCSNSHLSHACLDDALLNQCHFVQLNAPHSSWQNTQMSQCTLTNATLQHAHFGRSKLDTVIFCGIQGANSLWNQAQFNKTLLNLADLINSQFKDILAIESSWRDSHLEDSYWNHAHLLKCDLGEARLDRADVSDASFAHCLLIRSSFVNSKADNTDFFQALLRKANFTKAQLRKANLVRAMDSETQYEDADLDKALRTKKGEAV